MLSENSKLLENSPVPVVIDHYGVHGTASPAQSESQDLLRLLSMPHVWIKLSAPYRVSSDPLATKPDPAWLAAILATAADRCVWGSDWPHTPPHEEQFGSAVPGAYRNLRYETVVDNFMTAIGSSELAERILKADEACIGKGSACDRRWRRNWSCSRGEVCRRRRQGGRFRFG